MTNPEQIQITADELPLVRRFLAEHRARKSLQVEFNPTDGWARLMMCCERIAKEVDFLQRKLNEIELKIDQFVFSQTGE
jgi:hypothetical protein